MAAHRSLLSLCLLAGLWLLLGPRGGAFHRAAPGSPAAAGRQTAGSLFRQHCVRCHGSDGKGKSARRRLKVPDFTAASWQARRTDAQLLASILDGMGDEMPAWRGKISKEQARGLVAQVRSFAQTREKE